MYAQVLVRSESGETYHIVSVDEIRNFDPADYNKLKNYFVNSLKTTGLIIHLAETEVLLQKKIETKRASLPNARFVLSASDIEEPEKSFDSNVTNLQKQSHEELLNDKLKDFDKQVCNFLKLILIL